MSSDALPITPSAFAAALPSLPLSTLHLKAAELRNSIAHLEYSNMQLEPFAKPPAPEEGDPVCIEAIKENEVVMKQMKTRLELLKKEVENRGARWWEVGEGIDVETLAEEVRRERERVVEEEARVDREEGLPNGVAHEEADGDGRHSAWTDGTFQIGRITNGVVTMDGDEENSVEGARARTNGETAGGRLGDEELRRRMEQRLNDDEEEGMHL
jgi:hypothetical protein